MDPNAIVWVGDYPVIRNKTVAISIFAVATISVGLLGLLLVGLAIKEGNYEFIANLLKITGGIWLGFIVAMFLVGQLFFGGKVPVEVAVDDRGVTQIQRSKRARAANAMAVVGGLFAGGAQGATTIGAGMLAASRMVESYGYGDLRVAKGNPETGEIRLWDDWHTVMQIFTPPDRYAEVMGRIEGGISRAARCRPARADIPVAAKVLVCLGAIVFGTFLLAGFPLGFSSPFVLPMVALAIGTVLSPPRLRPLLGWILAAAVVLSVAILFKTSPPSLYERGAGLALGIQLAVVGLFALFGVCAGLGVYNLRPEAIRS